MPRRLLALESATDWLSVALLEDESLIALRRIDDRRPHAVSLLPLVDALLGDAGLRMAQIDALGVSAGPGSFTSLRIGLSTAKGIGFARSLPAVGVSTLEAMALSVLEGGAGTAEDAAKATERGVVVALLDARRGEWYAGGWSPAPEAGGLPVARLEEGLWAPERLVARQGEPARWIAPDTALAEGLRAVGVGAGGTRGTLIDGPAARPSAEWVGRLALRRLARGEGIAVGELGARYLRRADAEARRLGQLVEPGVHEAVRPAGGETS